MHPDKHKQFNKEARLAWKLKDIHHLHTNLMQAGLLGLDLHFGHPRILFVIKDLAGASQKEIAERLHVTPASLAMSLKRLEKGGFLQRCVDEKDQRINKIELTAKGLRAIRICHLQMAQLDVSMLKGLSEAELDQLSSYLSRIYDNLTEIKMDEIAAECQANIDTCDEVKHV